MICLSFRGIKFRIWLTGVPTESAALIFRLVLQHLTAFVDKNFKPWYFQ